MKIDYDAYLVGIGPWRIIPDEPRHNTFHMELKRIAPGENISLTYFGLSDMSKQHWMNQILPNSILRKYVAISPKKMREISNQISKITPKHKTIYIFEGSISWFITLKILSARTSNTTIICNLFSSGKYDQLLFTNGFKSFFFRWALRVVLRNNRENSVLTFDTKLMSDKVQDLLGINAAPFPVPSSFDFKKKNEVTRKHSRVLINIRGFKTSKLHQYLESSCLECTFVVPKGSISSGAVSEAEFGKYVNLEFDEKNISENDYAKYIDSFDYLIILYEPSINASGKILDAITRGVAVAVPYEATEWAQISRTWGKSHLFGWGNPIEESKLFQHPEFLEPMLTEEPPFTPRNAIKTLSKLSKLKEIQQTNSRRSKNVGWDLICMLYFLSCIFLNFQYSIRVKLGSNVSVRKRERRLK